MNDAEAKLSTKFSPIQSLWKLIESQIEEHECSEIKLIIGGSIVDQTLELHAEVDSLLSIIHEYKHDSEKSTAVCHLLDAPEVRDRLIREIKFFVDTLRERAMKHGLNPDRLIKKHSSSVIDYALSDENLAGTNKPVTITVDRTSPTETITSRSIHLAQISSDVRSSREKLTVFRFSEVLQHFREILEEELISLNHAIEHLQMCLESEADFRSASAVTPDYYPTLSELKEQRALLEREVLTPSLPNVPTIKTTNPVFQTRYKKVENISHVDPKSSRSIRPTKTPSYTPNPPAHQPRNVPLKQACYSLNTTNLHIPPKQPESDIVVPTKPRPNSAMRFRQMVQSCRDA